MSRDTVQTSQVVDRRAELMSEGWKEIELTFSLGKTLKTIQNPNLVIQRLKQFIQQFVSTTEDQEEWIGKILLASVDSMVNSQILKLLTNFSDSELDKIKPLEETTEIRYTKIKNGSSVYNEIDNFIINRVLEKLGNPILSSFELSSFYNNEELVSNKSKPELLKTKIKPDEELSIYWDHCFFNYRNLGDSEYTESIEVDNSVVPELVSQAVKGGRARVNEEKTVVGYAGEVYPLASFRDHQEIPEFTKRLESEVKNDKNNLKVLIKGGSGTCKSQWARSFAKEVLDPLGYFTFFFSPESINVSCIPNYLPKVCCVVDEFVAENRYQGNDYVKKMTNKFLRLFDDTAFYDVVPHKQEKVSQRIIWIFTSNYESLSDYDPAMVRRLDIIQDFTTDVNGEKTGYHLE